MPDINLQNSEKYFGAAKSLAILPFRFLRSGEAADDDKSFGIGLADALAARLYDVPKLVVRPTSSILLLVKGSTEPFEVGKKTKVDYVLAGHILTVGERLRFTVQLLSIQNHSVVWAGQFDEAETDIFSLEDSISARVVEALEKQFFNEAAAKFAAAVPESVTIEMTPAEITAGRKIDSTTEIKLPSKRLKFWAVSAAIALLIGTAAFFALRQTPAVEVKHSEAAKTLVILPFRSESEASRMLGVGLADALTSKLGTVHALSVRPATAGRGLVNAGRDPAAIGREVNANYVVRGTLNNQNGLQAAVEIVSAATGEVLAAENIGEPSANLSLLQVKIAESIVKFFKLALSPTETAQINKRHTENNLVYELYLIGRFQLADRNLENLRKAVETFQRTVEKDSNFALGYAGLADAHRLIGLYQTPAPPDTVAKSKENALKALSLDDSLGEVHAALGEIRILERDRLAAEQEYRRAIELNPSYASAHHWYALSLSSMGRHEEALREIQIAQRLDPYSAIVDTAAGMIYFFDRRYAEALAECDKALQKNPALPPAYRVSRWVHLMTGNYEAALDTYKKERNYLGDIDENERGWMMSKAAVEAVGGKRELALELINRSLTDPKVKNDPQTYAYEIALGYAFADDKENALLWLEKAETAEERGFVYAQVEPILQDKLGGDPRFAALVRKLQTPLR